MEGLKFFQTALKRILDVGENADLRRHLIVLILAIAIATGAYFLVADVLIDFSWERVAFDAILLLIFSVLYFLVRVRRRFTIPVHVASTLGLVAYAANFFVNSGIRGPTLVVVLMILGFITILHGPRTSALYLVAGLGLSLACLAVEWQWPGLITQYASREAQFLDIGATFVFATLMLFFVIRMLMRFFRESMERSESLLQAAAQSEKLAALGELMASINHEIASPVAVLETLLSSSQRWWKSSGLHFSRIAAALNPAQTAAFWKLVSVTTTVAEGKLQGNSAPRIKQRELEARLEREGFPHPAATCAALSESGFHGWDESWSPLMATPSGRDAFLFALEYREQSRVSASTESAFQKILPLVDSIAMYSRGASPGEPMIATKVVEGLESALTLYAPQYRHGVTVIRRYHEVSPVLARSDQLIQVWTNLIQNATQAMAGQGIITVEVKQVEANVVVSIADTGPGVSLELRAQIFKPFFTTKPRGTGTGLGLGIVRRIVTEHRGVVTVEEAEGGGARFVVTLPGYNPSNA